MTEDDIKKPGSIAAVFGCAGELVACTRKWAQRSARMMGPAETQALERALGYIAEIVVGSVEHPDHYEEARGLIRLARSMEQYERGAYQQNGERAITNAAEQLERAVKQPPYAGHPLAALPTDVAAVLREHDCHVSIQTTDGERTRGVYLENARTGRMHGYANLQELCDWARSPEGKAELAGTD